MRILSSRWFIILCCLFGLVPQPNQSVHAKGTGLGVSGSFANFNYTMTPGETLSNSAVTVTFFNTTPEDILVTLSGEGPAGTIFYFDPAVRKISAQSKLTVPVSFKLSQNLASGIYPISVKADILNSDPGVGISGFAQLNAFVTVLGQAGQVSIFLKDRRDQPFLATLTLVRIDEGLLTPLIEINASELHERLAPGQYRITAMFENTTVASHDFELKDKDDLKIDLIAQTVFVSSFMVGANQDDQERITSAEVLATIKNIHQREPSVSLTLEVTRNGKLLDNIPMMSLPELAIGELSFRFTVYPKDGFTAADYGLTLIVTSQEGLILAQSQVQSLTVPGNSFSDPCPWLIGGICLILLILLAKKRRLKDSQSTKKKPS